VFLIIQNKCKKNRDTIRNTSDTKELTSLYLSSDKTKLHKVGGVNSFLYKTPNKVSWKDPQSEVDEKYTHNCKVRKL